MPPAPRHDWYLDDWMAACAMTGTRLREITGWSKRKLSELLGGQMRYNRDVMNEAAAALNIAPFELLLHPSDANEIKNLRAAVHHEAVRIAAEQRQTFTPAPIDDAPLVPRRRAN